MNILKIVKSHALIGIVAIILGSFAFGQDEYHPGMRHLPNLGEPKEIETIDISYINIFPSDFAFFVQEGMEEVLDGYGRPYQLGFHVAAGHGDHEGLLRIVEERILAGTDILVVHPSILDLNTPIYEVAAEHGVPLIWFNVGPRGALDPEEFPVLSYVGYEHYEGGQLVGAFLRDFLEGEGTVGLLRFVVGDYVDERMIGAIDELEGTNIQLVEDFARGERDLGFELASNMLVGFDLDVIYGANTSSAMGALAAVEAAGMNHVGVIGYGATTEEVEAILEGRMLASVMRDPFTVGRQISDVIIKWWEGRENEIELGYGTFQKLVYSPDLVFEYVDPAAWEPWVEQHGRPDSGCPEERDIEEIRMGYHDPEHVANCAWIDRFRPQR